MPAGRPVDAIEGLSPSISVDQRAFNRSPRSTVGTTTEVFTYLRVLFARLGHRPCPTCGADIPPPHDVQGGEGWDDEPAAGAPAGSDDEEETVSVPALRRCRARAGHGLTFRSTSRPARAPPAPGLGVVHQVKLEAVIDQERSILDGAIWGWDPFFITRYSESLRAAGKHYGFVFDPALPVRRAGAGAARPAALRGQRRASSGATIPAPSRPTRWPRAISKGWSPACCGALPGTPAIPPTGTRWNG